MGQSVDIAGERGEPQSRRRLERDLWGSEI
jgi:hypothetical protein